MGVPGRNLKEKAEFRTLILDAAWTMVRQDGWASLSLRKISEAIDYSVPVIYDHFENKEAILLEFSRQGYLLLFEELKVALEKSSDPAKQLQAIAEAYWNFAFENTAYYQLMFGLGMPSSDMGKWIVEKNAFRHLVDGPINRILETNGHHLADSCVKYHTFWSVLHGLVSIKMLGTADAPETLNKLVLVDAITGFIRNLEN